MEIERITVSHRALKSLERTLSSETQKPTGNTINNKYEISSNDRLPKSHCMG